MQRYPHTYGGIATEVGTFHAKQIKEYFKIELPNWYDRNMKIFDFLGDDREVLIYSTDKANAFRVVCINRETTEQAQIKWDQFYAKRDWLKLNPIPGRK
jgi:hypothetical protein